MVKKKKSKKLGIINTFLFPKKKKAKVIKVFKKPSKKNIGMVLKERRERTLKRISERRRLI